MTTQHRSMIRTSRFVLLAAVLGQYVARFIRPIVLPIGPAQPQPRHDRPIIPSIDYSNKALTFKSGKLKKIYERLEEGKDPLLSGPESVVFGNDGTLYVTCATAKLLKLTHFTEEDDGRSILATVDEVKDLGIGSPLGGAFAPDDTLYIADAVLGLIRIRDPENPKSKVEIVASRVQVMDKDKGKTWSPIRFADDVTIGKITGKVYFTDATDIAPEWDGHTWDVLYASKVDVARGSRRGRVLEYDPETDQVRVLVGGIHFANGISMDAQEKFLIIAESMQARTLKYYLQGPKQGTLEPIDAFFPGYSDGVDCCHKTGLCYAAVPTPPGAMRIVYLMPPPLDRYIRTMFLMMPKSLLPSPPPFSGVVAIDPGDDTKEQQIMNIMLDPTGEDIQLVTGTTVRDNKLYLGFLKADFVGLYDLGAY